MSAPELIVMVRQWMQKAENDLRAAEHTLSSIPSVFTRNNAGKNI